MLGGACLPLRQRHSVRHDEQVSGVLRVDLPAPPSDVGVYAAPSASCWKIFCFSVPPCWMANRFPSSLFAYTVPFRSITRALTHHSNPFG